MAREPSFNFGANRKPKKAKSSKGTRPRSNAWRQYVVSNAPIPD